MLIHPSAVMWDYFALVIPLLEQRFHLLVPALPGYDTGSPEENFTSVEEIAASLAGWLKKHGIDTIDVLYGCSMGGSIVLRMLADQKVMVKNAICDGGITPYQIPWIATRVIAARDFLMVAMGKIGGVKFLEKAFSTDTYSRDDLKYVADVLHFMRYKTIWRTFESCNNFHMPKPVPEYAGRLQYWYGEKEEKDHAWDIRYVKENFSRAELVKFADMGHAGMASFRAQEMAERVSKLP